MTHRIAPRPVTPPEGGLVWVTSAVLSVAVGVTAAVLQLGALATVYLVGAMCLFGCLFVLPGERETSVWPSVLRQGVELGLAAGAAVGLVTAFGAAGILWLLSLAVTHHRVRQRLRGRFPRSDTAGPTVPRWDRSSASGDPPTDDRAGDCPSAHTTEDHLSQLSTEGLCLAWRRSFVVLGRARSTPCVQALAEHRKLILDEIDRRDRQGLVRWLASNPRAAGNPLPFLTPSSDSQPLEPPGTEQERP